ncbi:hypothetical protein BH11ACT8_BH11ACT8_28350 [soil metagenome]
MSDQAQNALLAVVLGSLAAVVLLLPVAAVQYRRNGRLGPTDLVVLLAAAVYGLALWAYTLLPTPAAGDYTCKGKQLVPMDSIRAIGGGGDGALALIGQPAFLQVALNVLLFVPFGFFVRRVLRRGVVVATGLGLAVSLLIECTQLTGDWGLYACPYRLFDVDDLLVNTLGATIGSLLSMLVVDREARRAPRPTYITFGRRAMGMACDVVFVVLSGAVVAIGWRGYELYVAGRFEGQLDNRYQTMLQWLVPLVLEGASVLLTGRTVGERVVAVRAVARRRWLTPVSRLLKLVFGVGAIFALVLVQTRWGFLALVAYAVLTLLSAARTTQRRGLSHALAGMDLTIDAEPERGDPRPSPEPVEV